MSRLLLLAALAGCTEPTLVNPTVELRGDAGPRALEASEVWEELGFRTTLSDFGQPDCAPDWYATAWEPCAIRVDFIDDPNQTEEWGTIGQAAPALRRIWIDALIAWDPDKDATYRMVVAHELGHILLDTANHLPPELDGLMGGGNDGQLSDADRDWACERIGACL